MTIKRKAVLAQDGTVENIILYDDALPEKRQWNPPDNRSLVDDDTTARVGGSYRNGKFEDAAGR